MYYTQKNFGKLVTNCNWSATSNWAQQLLAYIKRETLLLTN
jgi:hypothetical protein